MTAMYDVIIIGSGAGGGTLARHLASSGKHILLLERGGWLTREQENWNADEVFVQNRYVSQETWYDKDGQAFQPGVHYFVGGATKMYGAALYRLRREDFGEIKHYDGISPGWPISYDEMEPYYTKAEQMYHAHGARGEDPTEPAASGPYPHPPVSHEPRIQRLHDDLARAGYHPFHAPCGVYFGMKGFEHPMGSIQMVGKSQAPMYRGEKPIEAGLAPSWALDKVAEHAVDFWLSTEDLPMPDNRVTLAKDGRIQLSYTPNNDVPKQRLYDKLRSMLKHLDLHEHHLIPRSLYMKNDIGLAGVAHQAGTCRFGADPRTSVLDRNCKAHDVDNLYVVDTSFFPSIGAVNPALTAMANALRVGDHLLERLR